MIAIFFIANVFSAAAQSDGTTTTTLQATLQAQANAVPLETLLKDKTFAANWQDAKNLKGKSNELTAKKTLSEDDKTMLAMSEYNHFKEYPSTVGTKGMRAFLSAYLNDLSYMAPDALTDEFVTKQYLQAMQDMEGKMKNTKELAPDLKEVVDVDDL